MHSLHNLDSLVLWSYLILFVVVQSHSHVRLFATLCPAACQASLSLAISQSLPCINSTSNWKQFEHSNSYLGSDCLLCLKCLLFFFLIDIESSSYIIKQIIKHTFWARVSPLELKKARQMEDRLVDKYLCIFFWK